MFPNNPNTIQHPYNHIKHPPPQAFTVCDRSRPETHQAGASSLPIAMASRGQKLLVERMGNYIYVFFFYFLKKYEHH